jgi:hypothetical protein
MKNIYFDVFNSIYIKQLNECIKHMFKYKLSDSYNPKYDAIGLTYYKILEDYPDDIKLIEFAKKEFLK